MPLAHQPVWIRTGEIVRVFFLLWSSVPHFSRVPGASVLLAGTKTGLTTGRRSQPFATPPEHATSSCFTIRTKLQVSISIDGDRLCILFARHIAGGGASPF